MLYGAIKQWNFKSSSGLWDLLEGLIVQDS